MNKRLLTILFAFAIAIPLSGQVYVQLTLNEYLERVRKNNIEYAAERLNMEISDAEIISASVFSNPYISLGYYTNEFNNMQMGQGAMVEIGKTFSPGRRTAAINVAKSEKELNEILLTDFMRKLRGDAVLTWLEAVKQRQIIEIRKNSYHDQVKMMISDSIRREGNIVKDLDAMQSRVESGLLYSDIIDMELLLTQLYQNISIYLGTGVKDTIYIPETKNIWNSKVFNLSEIIQTAVTRRADIQAAKKEIDVSKLSVIAAKKERIPEFDIFLGYGFNSEVKNELAPAPRHGGIELGVSFPIPLFNRARGEIQSAEVRRKQAELRYLQAEREVTSEVINAFNEYMATDKKLKFLTAGIVKTAKEVLDEKRNEYNNGDIHLIEVLDAQRSYDEILHSLYSVIYDKSMALVKLETAMGVWNIE
ncbi:MAG: hypothetical protein A2X19_00710 [Bacteroidetes bacterium GWE2_39_28]|nr:MAG: hypothetical protein A2X19_00710 [Bacteroidetes bacterium GWE2_39_28]OFY12412.1 MAG: hypothetical protein A2X16_10635 [Bacteroidetes bacterium GWF2_39_10]OFZ06795.1 MAG: hypothetical protein A2322_08945 [Bacteroidetes bacterium RIFOXYB2_FULL_39_7]OFZ09843.1 MAG: hypothetical protein A2465_04765 [Bacteroidetes bacterium RIFOXYC2_FULL_39_11]HCT93352.1 hypothetical protein [Rikenellaceae bacterium]